METECEKDFRIPLISTSELEARSVSCTQEESNRETSLPALTNELLHAQHSQYTEIAEGQETLTILKDKIQEEGQKHIKITADIHAIAKQVYLAQDKAASTEAKCCTLKNNIFGLVKESSLLEMKLFDYQLQLESNHRLYSKYHQKMQDHIGKVTNAEQSHELYGIIALLEERISEAVDEKSAQSSNDKEHVGDEAKQIEERICVLEAAKDSQAMEQVELHDQDIVNNKIIHQLQQDIELLKKRQQAQLTRMHRQVQSLKHCAEKNRRLQSEIKQLKMKLD